MGKGRGCPVDRAHAIRRYLELRPIVRARLTASVPEDLHREFESLTPHQLSSLLLLPAEGLRMRELAAALGVMGASVSVLADRLVSQGLAVRMADPDDRRVVRLAPSERGTALAARAAAQQRRSAAQIFDRLSDDQVTAFLDVLETLAEPGTDDRRPSGAGVEWPGNATTAGSTTATGATRSARPRGARAIPEEAR